MVVEHWVGLPDNVLMMFYENSYQSFPGVLRIYQADEIGEITTIKQSTADLSHSHLETSRRHGLTRHHHKTKQIQKKRGSQVQNYRTRLSFRSQFTSRYIIYMYMYRYVSVGLSVKQTNKSTQTTHTTLDCFNRSLNTSSSILPSKQSIETFLFAFRAIVRSDSPSFQRDQQVSKSHRARPPQGAKS